MLDGLEVAVDGAREEVLAGRARLDGALEAAKVGLELARDGAPPDMAAERDGRLEVNMVFQFMIQIKDSNFFTRIRRWQWMVFW